MKKTIYIIMALLLVFAASGQQPWNTTELDDATDIFGQAVALNNLLSGMIGIGFIIITFMITLVITTANTGNILAGGTAGSFIATLGALLMLPLGLVGYPIFQICLVSLIVFMVATVLTK